MASGEWQVVEYERTRGDFPVRTFLADLTGRNKSDAANLLRLLAARGNMMRPPESKAVEGQRNLFELRGHIRSGSSTGSSPVA